MWQITCPSVCKQSTCRSSTASHVQMRDCCADAELELRELNLRVDAGTCLVYGACHACVYNMLLPYTLGARVQYWWTVVRSVVVVAVSEEPFHQQTLYMVQPAFP